MAALSIQVPYPVFYDRDGQPLDNGNIYIGVTNLDPVTNPIQVYYDDALTIPASQPLKTSGGYVYRNGTPTQLYVNAVNFSILVNDSKNTLVYSFPDGTGISPNASGVAFTGFKGQVGHVSDLAGNDGSDWIGFDPDGIGAVARSAQDKMRDIVSLKDFGAVGDGVTDDTAAIQAALDYVAAAVESQDPGSLSGGARGTMPTLYFPFGFYGISAQLEIGAAYTAIVGENATLTPVGGFTGTALNAAAGLGWRVYIEGLQFQNFSKGIALDSNNVNSGQVIIRRCGFFAITDDAVWLSCRSSNSLIEECMFRNNKHELRIVQGDEVIMRGGWIKRGVLSDDYDGGIVVEWSDAVFRMENVTTVPITQTANETAYIKNYGSVVCDKVRFGGETGQECAVNNFALGTNVTQDPKNSIIITNCGLYVGNDPAIRLFEIPNAICVTNNRGLTGASCTIVDWSSTIDPATQATKISYMGTTVIRNIISISGNILPYGTADQGVPSNLVFITNKPNNLLLASQASDFNKIVFDLRDTTIDVNDIYGSVNWVGRDAGGNAAGTRAQIRTVATGTSGGVKMTMAACANASATLVDVFDVTATAGVFKVPAQMAVYTVATLPAGVQGMRAMVTDATATTFASIVAGGGANSVPVVHNGTNWVIG